MIRLLSYTIAAKAAVILLLVLENHLKMSGFVVVDRAKRGRGPTVVKSVAGALIVVLSSFLRASSRSKNGLLTPPRRRHHAADDQVVLGKHLLEAYLMGFSLLLALIIDRTHLSLRELPAMTTGFLVKTNQLEGEISNLKMVRKVQSESAKREIDALVEHQLVFNKELKTLWVQVRSLESELEKKDKEVKAATSSRVQARNLESELEKASEVKAANRLKLQVGNVESEIEKKVKEVKAEEADKLALRKQSEGLLLEYDRLLEDYHNLRSQFQSIDWSLSRSNVKKKI